MVSGFAQRAPLRFRFARALDRAEGVYLVVLRATILVVATFLLVYCAWLALSSIYKVSRSPDSVVEQQSSVSADELTDAQAPAAAQPDAPGDKSGVNPNTGRTTRASSIATTLYSGRNLSLTARLTTRS
jgi:hypothetical protein